MRQQDSAVSQRRGAPPSLTLCQSNWAQQGSRYFSGAGIGDFAHLPSTRDLWCFLCQWANCPLQVLCVRKRKFLREFIMDYVKVCNDLLWRHLGQSMMMRGNCCAGWKGWKSQSFSITSIVCHKEKEKANAYLCTYLKVKKCAGPLSVNYVNSKFVLMSHSSQCSWCKNKINKCCLKGNCFIFF